MGRALTQVLTVGAALAVNLIPGAGTFLSAALGGTLGAGAGVTAFGVAAAQAVTAGLTLAGLSSLGGLLGLGPGMPKPDTSVTAIKTPRPPRVSGYGKGRLYGAYILYETAANGKAIDVFAMHDGQINAVLAIYVGDDIVTLTGNTVTGTIDGRYTGNLDIYHTMGLPTETAFSAVTALLPGVWTADHRGDGVVMAAAIWTPVKSKYYLEKYPNGQPPLSLVMEKQLCPDPWAEDPTDPSGWTWTENPIRQLMHYKLVREGVDYDLKFAPTIDYWRAAADVCDEPVALRVGGTEPRWRSWVDHKHTDKHGDVVGALLGTCDGWMAPRWDGALVVYAGKYEAPTVEIGPEHIVAYEWQGVGVDDDTAVNEIVCSYISEDHDYNVVECDSWRDEGDISERGQILSDTLEPQVPSWGQVRRLAKRRMARTNAALRGTVTTNVAGRIAWGQRYIRLNLTEVGTTFVDAIVEITAVTRNIATGGLTFSWVLADANIDAWNPAFDEGEPAAKGDRIAPQPLETPVITAATYFESGPDGSRIRITATGPDREDLTWFVRWRTVGASTWGGDLEFSDVDPSAAVTLETDFVPVDSSVEVQAAYRIGDGRYSEWSDAVTVGTTPATFDSEMTRFDSTTNTFDRES